MVERVTGMGLARRLSGDIALSARRLADAQEKISSGKQLNKPSDDPTGVLNALSRRGELSRYDQYDRSATDAQAWLNTADSTLATVTQRVHRARDLLLGAVNGSADQPARDAAATELDALAGELVGLANTTYLNRPIFAGVVNTPTAFAPDGTYQGDGGTVDRAISPGSTITVNVPGDQVFGTHNAANPAAGDLFQVVRQAAADLRAGNVPNASSAISSLDTALNRVAGAQATIGARTNQLESIGNRNAEVVQQLKSALSEVEDVDYAKAIIDVQTRQMAYQASLSVTAKIVQPSLLDFLR